MILSLTINTLSIDIPTYILDKHNVLNNIEILDVLFLFVGTPSTLEISRCTYSLRIQGRSITLNLCGRWVVNSMNKASEDRTACTVS